MRFSTNAASAWTLFTTLISLASLASATPKLLLENNFGADNSLQGRDCASPCGWQGQLCCSAGQQCTTDSNNWAVCTTGAPAAGNWQLYTTVYVTTEEVPKTVTNVYSLQAAGGVTVTVTVGGAQPTCSAGQKTCGSTCCRSDQFCNSGTCLDSGATTGGGSAIATVAVSAPIRPTSISTYTVITTNGATSTVPFLMPATASASSTGAATAKSTSGSGLSGGAIAGIVIGVLAGIIILILLIICCCARGLLDIIRPKRKTEVTEIYEGHHHSGGSARPPPKKRFGLFGGGGGGGHGGEKKGWAGVAGILAAVALVLGLKRRHDRKQDEKASTAYTYSEYTYDYSTSASSESSDDRRTRHTRQSDRRSSRR